MKYGSSYDFIFYVEIAYEEVGRAEFVVQHSDWEYTRYNISRLKPLKSAANGEEALFTHTCVCASV